MYIRQWTCHIGNVRHAAVDSNVKDVYIPRNVLALSSVDYCLYDT